MRTDDGTFIGVRIDITELKQREKALRDSMRQIDLFRHMLDELPVAAFIKADDLRIEYVNKAWTIDDRHLQGRGGRPHRCSSCSQRRGRWLHRRRHRGELPPARS